MQVEKCATLQITEDTPIKVGDWVKSKGGDWGIILRVEDNIYTQSTNGWSNQSMNYPKEKRVMWVYNQRFLTKYGISDFIKLFEKIYSPNHSFTEMELLDRLN